MAWKTGPDTTSQLYRVVTVGCMKRQNVILQGEATYVFSDYENWRA